jgi:RimJ/RimL family protein N-acetyltransferase
MMDAIVTCRLLLRPFTPDDLEALHAVIGEDPDMSWNGEPRLIDETANVLQRRLNHYEQHGFGVLAVVLKATGKMIGQNGLQVVKNSHSVELVVYTAKRYQRQGLAFEACSGSLTYGFAELKLSRIVANIRPQNIAAHRLVAKLGFHFVGKDRVHGHDVSCYAIRRETFDPGTTPS